MASPLALALMLASAPANAQSAPSPSSTPASEAARPELQLRGIEDTLRQSESQRAKIEAEVQSIQADRAKLASALIEATAKVQDAEGAMQTSLDKLAALGGRESALQRSLAARRGLIGDVLAILQRMGRNPPPAILVRPQDMSEAIRAAILLGAVIPDLKLETEALARDLDELGGLRAAIDKERQGQAERAQNLRQEKTHLAALIEARQQSLAAAEASLGAERERSHELARQAATLKELITRMETEVASAKSAAAAAEAAAEIKLKAGSSAKADPARLAPAIAFADTKGKLSLPVSGTILKSFGDQAEFGGAEKGISVAAPTSATVASPVDGWVVFSGPYRKYGQILILNAGDGYYLVLAGMERINVSVGQFVLAGEPVAAMGDGSARTAAAAAIGAVQPVLYIELRKNGAAIDPGPWWSKPDSEKARG